MYPPAHFYSEDRALLQRFLQQHYFGVLLSTEDGLNFSPLPFMFDWHTQPGTAYCHMARNNPQLRQLEGKSVTILIQGPHAFVAASCYQRQPAVSTWNYAIAELQGTARLMNTEQTLALVRRQEADSAPGMAQAEVYQQQLVQAIVGVEISLERLSGRFKLSQNKTLDEQQRVRQFLQHTEQPATVWQLMQHMAG